MQPKTTQHISNTSLITGFSIMIGLLISLMISSIFVLDKNLANIESLVQTTSVKSRLSTELRTAARERILRLQQIALEKDIFRQDEIWMEFLDYGTRFITTRDMIRDMPLSDNERSLLAKLDRVISLIGPIQADIAEKLQHGNREQGIELVLTRANELQSQAFAVLTKFNALQEKAAANSLTVAHADYRRSLSILVIIGSSLIIISIVISIYVTRRTARAKHAISEQMRRAQITLNSIAEGVISTNAQGKIEQLNPNAELLLARDRIQVLHRPVDEIFLVRSEHDRNHKILPVRAALNKATVVSSGDNKLLSRPDGQSFPIEYTVAPILDGKNHVTGAILVFRDVTETRALTNQLAYQASHDPLTGLHNRYEFELILGSLIEEANKNPSVRNWLCYIDLDQFKVINDTCGHTAGDELLMQIANLLRDTIVDTSMTARIGGDEFSVILIDCSHKQAREQAETLCTAFEELHFAWDNKSFNTTASIGLAPISSSLASVMSMADMACYAAKEAGRNRVHEYYSEEDNASMHEAEMQWVHRINDALTHNRFVLYYQPIKPLGTDKTDSPGHCEILLRMLSDSGELIPPLAFIPAAERYNLMAKIDKWVIENTINLLQDIPANISLPGHCSISINLSAQTLNDESIHDFILDQLSHCPIPADKFCFEVTETYAIAHLSKTRNLINRLKSSGCRFALDDFGSGLSSFAYLKNLPVDYLKIDGCFIRNIHDDEMDYALVESINQIGHILGMQTVAEYVDSEAKMEQLIKIGVDFAQGYHLGRPQPFEQFIARLKATHPDSEPVFGTVSRSGV